MIIDKFDFTPFHTPIKPRLNKFHQFGKRKKKYKTKRKGKHPSRVGSFKSPFAMYNERLANNEKQGILSPEQVESSGRENSNVEQGTNSRKFA